MQHHNHSPQREKEFAYLEICEKVIRGEMTFSDLDATQASVMFVCADVIKTEMPLYSELLLQSAEKYFKENKHSQISAANLIKSGDIIGMPRLRDMLQQKLRNM